MFEIPFNPREQRLTTTAKTALITRVAELYYERELSQKDIADMLELSRPMVSRLLAEAKESGVVTISINRPLEKREDLAKQVLNRFELKEVIVVPGGDPDTSRKNVGVATAELLTTILRNDDIIGVSWGRDLYHTISSLAKLELENIQVAQLAGGLGEGDAASDGPEIARLLGEKLSAQVRYLYAPTVVQTADTKKQLIEQAQLAQTITLASQIDVALTGIGAIDDLSSSLGKAGYISEKDRKALKKQEGKAHLLGYMLDAKGKTLKHNYNDRVVAAPLKYLKRAKWSIGIASGVQKADAVLAALQGGYFNTLVLSEDVATQILEAQNQKILST